MSVFLVDDRDSSYNQTLEGLKYNMNYRSIVQGWSYNQTLEGLKFSSINSILFHNFLL
ncbi:hypothetical protein SAMN06295989_1028 [Methanohalophilus euhalobius]|uniref:Uncharacterized protein n=1 Tax=Methanohalophilus euhalobius TaxID=51203 RepID=A0A285EYC3_9EURY|nr:MAG: hypothetical protein A8273_1917 [Methanohalophilus sp. 2-GBenrich]SNY03434.1 hypothetical protein SAMN06295989_1028 [Methanohalophilus euhalobius]